MLSESSKLYMAVLPVVGHLASKSVAALYPFDQHVLVKGPFVHAESATLVEVAVAVACRFASVVGRPASPQRI